MKHSKIIKPLLLSLSLICTISFAQTGTDVPYPSRPPRTTRLEGTPPSDTLLRNILSPGRIIFGQEIVINPRQRGICFGDCSPRGRGQKCEIHDLTQYSEGVEPGRRVLAAHSQYSIDEVQPSQTGISITLLRQEPSFRMALVCSGQNLTVQSLRNFIPRLTIISHYRGVAPTRVLETQNLKSSGNDNEINKTVTPATE